MLWQGLNEACIGQSPTFAKVWLWCGQNMIPFISPSAGFRGSNLRNLLGFFAILQGEDDLMDAVKKPASQDLGDSMLGDRALEDTSSQVVHTVTYLEPILSWRDSNFTRLMSFLNPTNQERPLQSPRHCTGCLEQILQAWRRLKECGEERFCGCILWVGL